ncbi:phosphatase family protein-like protein [Massarina eburnea CBS 473.64]|uniref:Phosphatase family protein-like protein n=1 Tax=Massarina eburnea CBS 473.64 TaxID=1395130 RepID=A0A6A6RRH8_9PLEO|nr:phosphatase family protein-like protein [Massarina eburnea CBS 473.64]
MASETEQSATERLDSRIPGAFPEASGSQPVVATHQSLPQALYDRRLEYTRARNVRIKVGSWNVAGLKGLEQDVGAWFVGGKGIEESLAGLGVADKKAGDARESIEDQEARRSSTAPTVPHNDKKAVAGDDEVGIYALGLQEVVDINSMSEALRPYTDPSVAARWKQALVAAMPEGYQLVAEQQLIGLLLLIYVSPSIHPQVKAVSTTSVGTGLMGYMGNKGAVTARLVLGETTRLVFVNAHLSAGADKASVDRRIWDAAQITSRTRFEPVADAVGMAQSAGERLGDEDFAFWFGDLNFRLVGMGPDDVRHLLTIHAKGLNREQHKSADVIDNTPISTDSDSVSVSKTASDFEIADESEDDIPVPPELDPASLQTTIDSLLPHDELLEVRKAGKAFHDGWHEGPIRFLPSYKYDLGKVAVFDSSDKRRCPSWCDRILYRTRAARQRYEESSKEQEDARKKDEEMKAVGLETAGDDESVLYDYNPDTDGTHDTYDEYDDHEDDPEPETVSTKDGFQDEILLESYTNHMRVLSSDHKPMEAVFFLKYDAVVPELKSAIHQEVARELDRQENEGRPSVTLVVDRSTGSSSPVNAGTTDSSFDGVDFGDVRFVKSKRRNITIANTGRVPATFWFTDRPVSKDQPEGPFPPWLSVAFDREPDAGAKASSDNRHQQFTLEPADLLNAELKFKMSDLNLVRDLNDGVSSLDEILVLRIHEGRDHFLPLRGNWQQSALSRTVDKLSNIPEGGIRKLQGQKPDVSQGVRYSVPRELFRLTEAIEDLTERTLAEWGMTGQEGNKEKAPWQHNAAWPFAGGINDPKEENMAAEAHDALDCDEPFEKAFPTDTRPKQKLEIITEVFLTFLRSLQDGIITKSLWEKLEEGFINREKSRQPISSDDEKMWALEILSAAPIHNASFLLTVSMLQNVDKQIVDASKLDETPTPRSSVELPSSPRASVRRKTLSKVPQMAVKQLVLKNHAAVFADVLFRAAGDEKLKEREKTARKERMVKLVELFLWDE